MPDRLTTRSRRAPSLLLGFAALTGCASQVTRGPDATSAPDVSVAADAAVDGAPGRGDASEGRDAPDARGPDVPTDATPDGSTDAAPDAATPECRADADCVVPQCNSVACVAGRCVATAAPSLDGTPCADDDVCTRGEVCRGGVCAGGARVSCGVCAPSASGGYLVTFPAREVKRPEALVAELAGGVALTGFGEGSLWFARVAADGSAPVERTFGDPWLGDVGFAMAPARDGGYLLAGYSQLTGPALAWVVRTDAAGNELWSRSYFRDVNGSFHGAVALDDGGFVLLANAGGRATLVRIDAAGETVWQRGYYDVGSAYGLAGLVALPGGGFAFAGNAGAFPAQEARVVRTDGEGVVVWDRVVGSGPSYDALAAIVALDDGGVVVSGRSGDGPRGVGSAWLVRVSAAGAEVWSRFYGTDINGSIASVARIPEGGFLLGASTHGDAWVIRTDEAGAVVAEATLALGWYEHATAVHALPGGVMLVAGVSSTSFATHRLPSHAFLLRTRDLGALACPAD